MKRYFPPFLNCLKFKDRIALIDTFGKHSFDNLFNQSKVLCKNILNISKIKSNELKTHPLKREKIAFLCENDHTYISAQWGAWMSGSTAVPLSKYHPIKELEFIISDCKPKVLLCTENFAEKLLNVSEKFDLDFMVFDALLQDDSQVHCRSKQNLMVMNEPFVSDKELMDSWNHIHWEETNAQIVYTSGTTGRPKGVVTTFANISSQINDLNTTWNVTSQDGYLHVLPLHHVHGIVNNLLSPLTAGASITMLKAFCAEKVWWHLLEDENVNVFHAVPTIYSKLIEYYTENLSSTCDDIRDILKTKFRLMVSGSAALPVPVLKRWEEISGHVLLERYGMTEIGMALTNPLQGPRIEGAVGKPFPSVKFRIRSEDNKTIAEGDHEKIVRYADGDGSLLVKGPSVFKEYLNLDNATKDSFDDDGWFITGDTAVYDSEHDVIRIMGRTSVDIINSAGYKMSALEIEKHLLCVEGIREVAVIGLPDDVYGEVVCAVVVSNKNHTITLQYVQEECKDVLAIYKIPRAIKVLDEIPKNAMGKVNKKLLISFILNNSS